MHFSANYFGGRGLRGGAQDHLQRKEIRVFFECLVFLAVENLFCGWCALTRRRDLRYCKFAESKDPPPSKVRRGLYPTRLPQKSAEKIPFRTSLGEVSLFSRSLTGARTRREKSRGPDEIRISFLAVNLTSEIGNQISGLLCQTQKTGGPAWGSLIKS